MILYSQKGNTPLHRAAVKNALGVAALLIKRGANIDEADRVCTEHSLLFMSLSIAKFSLKFVLLYVTFFMYYPPPLSLDQLKNVFICQNGWTPLHYAAYFNALNVAALLIEKGANLHAVNNVCTRSCLYLFPLLYFHLSLLFFV